MKNRTKKERRKQYQVLVLFGELFVLLLQISAHGGQGGPSFLAILTTGLLLLGGKVLSQRRQ
jgi:hypothetical protein